jgi:hypothetical protein
MYIYICIHIISYIYIQDVLQQTRIILRADFI